MPERSEPPANHDVYVIVCRRFPLLFNRFPAPRACSHFRGPCRNMQMAVTRLRFLTSSHWASGTAALAMFCFGVTAVWYGYRVCTSQSELAWRRLHRTPALRVHGSRTQQGNSYFSVAS